MRKVIAATILAIAAALSAPAAHQYEIDSDGLRIKEDIALSIRIQGASTSRSYDRFGVFVLSLDGTSRTVSLDLGNDGGRELKVGDFAAGDRLVFFAGAGDALADQFALSEKDDSLAFLRITGGRTGDTIDIRLAGGNGSGDHCDGKTVPVGQPLPGVLGALLLGGGAWGIGKFKWRKKPGFPDGNQL